MEQQKETFEPEDTEPTYIPNTGIQPCEDFVQVRYKNGVLEVCKANHFEWEKYDSEWQIEEYFVLPRT
ncbi:hypothetical protein, partial [Escherichia coli]|uniref:hypothetical protein n=1 Tax=Escherichia coli TaxID=562 RepID=UPI001CDA816F